VHGLGTKSTEYLDMTSEGVFVHCMVEEGKLISDRILLVTPLEDMQIKAPVLSEDEPIIIYLDTSGISTLSTREELFQLTAPEMGSEDEIEDPTPLTLSIEEDYFDDDSSKAPTCDKGSQIRVCWTRPGGTPSFQGKPPRTICYNQQKLVSSY
jgi:hypothetical protein